MSEETTILVVDDNRPLADGFARILAEEYEVLTAYEGKRALELFTESIDVVLLDRRLPDIPGDEVLAEIREREYDCSVAMVSAGEPDPSLDCDAYLTKPVRSSVVLHDTVSNLAGEGGQTPPT